MTRKQIDKKLKELASKIPPEITKIQQFSGEFDEQKQPIMEEREVWSNHGRRLRKLWNSTHSVEELQRYFDKFNMKLNEQPTGDI